MFFVLIFSYTTGRAVFGKCKILAVVKTADDEVIKLDDLPRLERYIEPFEGVIDFFFSMKILKA